ncbi:ClpX C4-type zinc finger protein [Nocardia alni]|uniref:ClpX C4-type zinc finger protein n=1 Tax=Nocardia alni TaxID=2815723 RepID=UPI001C23CF1E|nr:ClpX C4-type zinc finger protein [Nocardia alni]
MTAPAPALPHCSFCGKPAAEVRRLVAGAGVNICDQCVGLAATIIEQYTDTDTPAPLHPFKTLSDEQMLEHIPRIATVSAQVEENLRTWVDELRRRKITWTRIGSALGMTRQSAWERFSGEE